MRSSIFETILNENKDRFMDALNVSEEKKKEYKAFFTAHPNLDGSINWNKFVPEDIEALMKETSNSRSSAKRDFDKMFSDNEKWHFLFETDNYYVVQPLCYEAAVFADSFNCGGYGAKWCIGSKSPRYWTIYSVQSVYDLCLFALVMNKHPTNENDIKYMIQYTSDGSYNCVWDQKDTDLGSFDECGIDFDFSPEDIEYELSHYVNGAPKNFYMEIRKRIPTGCTFDNDDTDFYLDDSFILSGDSRTLTTERIIDDLEKFGTILSQLELRIDDWSNPDEIIVNNIFSKACVRTITLHNAPKIIHLYPQKSKETESTFFTRIVKGTPKTKVIYHLEGDESLRRFIERNVKYQEYEYEIQ